MSTVPIVPAWVTTPADMVDEIAEAYDVPREWLERLGELITRQLQASVDEALDFIRASVADLKSLDNPLSVHR